MRNRLVASVIWAPAVTLNDMMIKLISTTQTPFTPRTLGILHMVAGETASNCMTCLQGPVSGRHAGAGQVALKSVTTLHLRLSKTASVPLQESVRGSLYWP